LQAGARGERGAALVIALVVMAGLLLLGTAFLSISSTESEIARNAREATQAFYIAEAGLARLQRDLVAQFAVPFLTGCAAPETFADLRRGLLTTGEPLGVPGQERDADGAITCGPPGAVAYYALRDAANQPATPVGPEWRTVPYARGVEGGALSVALRNATADTVEARVIATGGGTTRALRQLEATLQVATFRPADHALFTERPIMKVSEASPLVIGGPLFVKGWSATAPAINLGRGGAPDRIVNSYRTMDGTLQAAITPLTPTAGGDVGLNATLRVYLGPVEISHPSASAGEATVPGNGVKESLDAVYTNQGFTGVPGAANAYSDNGTGNRFDLPRDLAAFPDLGGPYTGVPQGGGATPTSHDAFLRDGALSVEGGLTIDNTTPAFSYPSGLSDLSACTGNCLIYRPAQDAGTPPTLLVQGKIWIKGNLALGGMGSQRLAAIRYRGSGTLYARGAEGDAGEGTGSVQVSADLLPAAGGTFPTDHRLGLISGGWTLVGDGSPGSAALPTLRIAAQVYASTLIYNFSPYQLAGSVLARNFYVGAAAGLYYVPALGKKPAPGMPGMTPARSSSPFFIRRVAWRDVVP
jgi:hypothetical protein